MTNSPLDDILIGEQTSLWAKNNKLAVQYLETCDSTNTLAKKEAFSESVEQLGIKIYLTDLQTQGRGRGANTWTSLKPGKQLLMTWSFQLADAPLPILSPLLGLALWTACRSTWVSLPWSLKAPNDLYLGNKKIAGILLENVLQGEKVRTIIGLGLNVLEAPPEVKTSTSLFENLPTGCPLLAEDWFCFLDRLSLEFSLAISSSFEPLTTTAQHALISALNEFTELKKKYTQMDASGNLWQGTKKTNWMDL